jgi:hypothetical protein
VLCEAGIVGAFETRKPDISYPCMKATSKRSAAALRQMDTLPPECHFPLCGPGASAGGQWVRVRLMPPGAPSLYRCRKPRAAYRCRKPRAAQVHAGAGGGKASDLQQLRCQEHRELQSDLGEAGCKGRWCGTLSEFHRQEARLEIARRPFDRDQRQSGRAHLKHPDVQNFSSGTFDLNPGGAAQEPHAPRLTTAASLGLSWLGSMMAS